MGEVAAVSGNSKTIPPVCACISAVLAHVIKRNMILLHHPGGRKTLTLARKSGVKLLRSSLHNNDGNMNPSTKKRLIFISAASKRKQMRDETTTAASVLITDTATIKELQAKN